MGDIIRLHLPIFSSSQAYPLTRTPHPTCSYHSACESTPLSATQLGNQVSMHNLFRGKRSAPYQWYNRCIHLSAPIEREASLPMPVLAASSSLQTSPLYCATAV